LFSGARVSASSVVHARLRGALPRLRPVHDQDSQDLFGLLALCFAEHPGCFVDPHDDLADLRRPASSLAGRGGVFWGLEDDSGRLCACVAFDRPDAGSAELHRLYVRPDRRRRGLAGQLVTAAEAAARDGGATIMVLWSDTRFTDAHRLYERLGYRATGESRHLGDISGSVERRFEKSLG
jgi:putative acetyltransferase